MTTSKEILDGAAKYVGTVEKYNNNVIFNTWYYGHSVSGDQYPWCCCYIFFVFNEANASSLLYDGKKTALCQTLADWFKVKKQWYSTPQIGDIVFFKYGSSARYTDHVGIVEIVNKDGSIGTIEGNTSDKNNRNGGMVMRRVRRSGIVGYGRPKYDSSPNVSPMKNYLYKGVDVSAAQKNVNYHKLKESDVDFTIIKIIRKDLNPDEMFEKHYAGFTSAGISCFGVYNYSYATTVNKARTDAQIVLKILSGRKLLVCLDVEDNVQKGLGSRLIDIINAYQDVIEKAGLPFMLYTGMAFYNQYIQPWESSLRCKDLWIARYYNGDIVMPFHSDPDNSKKPFSNLVGWQYTSHGSVSGYNGNIDLNVIYRDISSPAPVVSKKIITKVKTNGSKLNVRNSIPDGKVVDKLSNGAAISVLDVKGNWYKIGENKYVCADYVLTNTMGVITTGALNIRDSDSKKGSSIGTYRKGDTVRIMGQSETGWYLTPKGWISNNYVKLL